MIDDTPTTPNTLTSPQSVTSSSHKSRFKFQAKNATNELVNIEQNALRKHADTLQKVHDLELQMVKWDSKFLNELVVKRNNEQVNLIESILYGPLQGAMKRVMERLDKKVSLVCYKKDEDDKEEKDNSCDQDAISENIIGSLSVSVYEKEQEDMSTLSANDNETLSHYDQYQSPVNTKRVHQERIHSPTNDKVKFIMDRCNLILSPNTQSTTKNKKPVFMTHQQPTKSITTLFQDIHKFNDSLNQYTNQTIPQSLQSNILSLRQDEIQNCKTLQTTPMEYYVKSEKKQNVLFRNLESMAGLSMKSYVEENAKRMAQLTLLEERIDRFGPISDDRKKYFLEQIQSVRELIEKERRERMERDEYVLNLIVENKNMIQALVLEQIDKMNGGDDY